MLQQPTPALVAFYHRVCFQQLSDIANESSPELAERFAGLSSMSMPESSVEHLLQARQTSTEYVVWVCYMSNALACFSMWLHSHLAQLRDRIAALACVYHFEYCLPWHWLTHRISVLN